MTLDLDFLRPVLAAGGPFASVTLEAGREAGDAADAVRLRWRGVRAQLQTAGADGETLRAMDDVAATPPGAAGMQGQVIVASGGEVLLDECFHPHPGPSTASWSPLPEVLPLLRTMRAQQPCLVVEADAAGADIQIRAATEVVDTTVEGDTHPLHKVPAGGLSHRRIHRRVEETVKHNAKAVAERVADLVGRVEPAVVVLAGDPQAVTSIWAEAPPAVRDLVVEIEAGSRHTGARSVDDEVDDVLAAQAEADDAGRLAAYRSELSNSNRAAAGLDATVGCLRKGQVDTVLLEDAHASDRLPALWLGDDFHLLARDARVLDAMGAADQHEVSATAALTAGAAATGAHLALVADGSVAHRDGVGALLRYADT